MKTIFQALTVETTENKLMPYILKGPKGAHYGLYRNLKDASLLYAITPKGKPTRIKGFTWFTDKNGIIEGIRF